MSDLITISKTLGELYKDRAELSLQEWQIEKSVSARKVELTPIEGWPGKNAEQREIEAERTYSADGVLQVLAIDLYNVKKAQSETTGLIEALEAERRGLEWSIRLGLVQALNGKHDDHNDEFDDGLNVAADAILDEIPVDYSEFHETLTPAPTFEMLAPEPEDELPF